ncbi:HAD family hydrolase [Actinopolymorpha alba]|uniref:HAD family hydrolase n=1 Tax=Actinopolymorpha alba TaxID=533267 RepID=UPI000379198D|nr:HAD-IA family hydrolase [Actinopolymorpha alba]
MTSEQPALDVDRISAVIFDTDGVITDTARVHAAAWKRCFDEFLRRRGRALGRTLPPFDVRQDYLDYVDGKPRLNGVRDFLAARGITLPEGSDADEGASTDGTESADTVHALAARKNRYFLEEIGRYGVAAFPSTVALVRELRDRGARTAAVSASRNCARVLTAAHVQKLFDVRVDGIDADELGLPGKPDPALFLETARRLRAKPAQAAVIEDTLAGVEAAHRGGFGLIVAVDRGRQAAELRRLGAHIVVEDLGELTVSGRRRDSMVVDL